MESSSAKPCRGMTAVASRFNGWYAMTVKTRAFRYATKATNGRVPKDTHACVAYVPAVKWLAARLCRLLLKGRKNLCQMLMASSLNNTRNLNYLY